MAIPITTGANPQTETIVHGSWVKTHENVNKGIIKTKNTNETTEVFLTYLKTGDPAPVAFEDPEVVWKLNTPPIKVADGSTKRDIYVWAKDYDVEIEIEG